MLKFAFSDLHGAYDQTVDLMGHIHAFYPKGDKQFLFLGDYIDRGPKTRELLDLLMLYDDGSHVFLRGNHDCFAINDEWDNWMYNGGKATLDSYPDGQMSKRHLDWLRTTGLFHQDDQRTYVHAGFYRNRPIEVQDEETLTWIREEFLYDDSMQGGFVVHGHTPTIAYGDRTPTLDITENQCNVDTGAVYGGVLSCAVFDESQTKPIASLNHLGEYRSYK